jgi:hypothetical protein
MGTDRDGSFDMVLETFRLIGIIITMVAWLLVGLIAAVVVAFLGVGIEWIWLVPVGALAAGAVNCVVMTRKHG